MDITQFFAYRTIAAMYRNILRRFYAKLNRAAMAASFMFHKQKPRQLKSGYYTLKWLLGNAFSCSGISREGLQIG